MTIDHDLSRAAYRRWLWIIMLVGCAARIGLVAYATAHPGPFDFPDSHRYVRVANNIAAGRGPIDSGTTLAGTDPVYPAMLAIEARYACASDEAVMFFGRVINSLFGMAAILLVAAIGRHLFSRRVGAFAAAWCAIDPILLYFNALVLTELPYIAMLLAAVLLIVRFDASRRMGHVVLAGALLGLATLTRSSGLLLPFLFAIWLAITTWRVGARGRAIGAAAALLISMFVVMTPVIYRNYRLFDAFVPVRTGSGASLLEALGPWADGSPGMDRIEYPAVPAGATEVERDRVYRNAALSWVESHPLAALRLAGRKLVRTWSITIHAAAYQSWFYTVIGWVSVVPIYLLALVGVWRTWRHRSMLVLLLLPAAYFTLIHMVFVGSVRYRLPAMPFIFILAAVGLCALVHRPVWSPSEADS